MNTYVSVGWCVEGGVVAGVGRVCCNKVDSDVGGKVCEGVEL